jgi:uncharacterized protein (TIGR04255 family)
MLAEAMNLDSSTVDRAMARQRPLAHAPIVEALVDIQVEPRADLTYAQLHSAFATGDSTYHVKGPISEGTFGIHLQVDGTQAKAESHATQIGLRLHSSDEKYVVQYRLGGFTLSRLAPYQDWPALRAEAERLWTLYVAQVQPRRITRAAVRYINNLRLPMPMGASFQKYIEKLVDVPESVPQLVTGFLQRFQLRDESSNAEVIVTLALNAQESGESAPVILDVDAFNVTSLAIGDPALWNNLETLRGLKNRCFFGIVTEAAVELYE